MIEHDVPDTQHLFIAKIKEKKFLFLFFFVLISLLFVIVAVRNKQNPSSIQNLLSNAPLPRTWDIHLLFDTQNQTLSVKSVAISKGIAFASPITISPYEIIVFDKNRNELFRSHIQITELVTYNFFSDPNTTTVSFPALSQTIESLVTIPYFSDADQIEIQKNQQTLLTFQPPKSLSMGVQKAYANTACHALHVVFISDGYTDFVKFHSDVAMVKQALLAAQPYAAHAEIFDFDKVIDNRASLGCIQNGQLQPHCTLDSLNLVTNMVYQKYPDLVQMSDYTKILLLVNATPYVNPGGGTINGVANGPGSSLGAFSTQPLQPLVAIHEMEGHAIGFLWDRYVYPDPASQSTIQQVFSRMNDKSNCTDNANGENFWRTISGTGSYAGCTLPNYYAPYQQDCAIGNVKLGTRESIMSDGYCHAGGFDKVEQAWINQRILPFYSSYAACSTATASPSSPVVTATATQRPATTIPATAIPLNASPTQQVIIPTYSAPTTIAQVTPIGKTNTSAGFTPENPVPTDENGDPLASYSCVPDPSCVSNKNSLQLCKLICGTTQALQSIPKTSPTSSQPGNTIDFSDPALDWDDVGTVMQNCTTISRACMLEFAQASINEVGANGYSPGSRVYMCWGNKACREHGYSAYDGPNQLPVFPVTAECRHEFNQCPLSAVSTGDPNTDALVQADLSNQNCDKTDLICLGPGDNDYSKALLYWY